MKYIRSENYLCLATLFEMIIDDIGYAGINRKDIASYFGITLPIGTHSSIENVQFSENERDWGMHFSSEIINRFFEEKKIPIYTEFVEATPYTSIEDDARNWGNSYTIFLYSYGELYSKDELMEVGHASLFIGLNKSGGAIIYDPGPRNAGVKIINCHKMEEAMYQRRAGYLLNKIIALNERKHNED